MCLIWRKAWRKVKDKFTEIGRRKTKKPLFNLMPPCDLKNITIFARSKSIFESALCGICVLCRASVRQSVNRLMCRWQCHLRFSRSAKYKQVDFVFLLRTSAIFKQAWLRLALSRLGIIQTSLASALAAPELDIALGLASVCLLHSLSETFPIRTDSQPDASARAEPGTWVATCRECVAGRRCTKQKNKQK